MLNNHLHITINGPFSSFKISHRYESKTPNVGYYNHFPKNFLCPHGLQKAFPLDNKVFYRLRPEGWKWLHRPNTAISELGSTIKENIPLLQSDTKFLDHEKLSQFLQNITPLGDLLKNSVEITRAQTPTGQKSCCV